MNENENNLDEIRTDAAEPETMAEEIPAKSETIKRSGNYKTVQQLAHEYGMSKNGIMTRLNKLLKEIKENNLDESDYISRGLKNTIYVLEPGLVWFAKFQADNTPMQSISVSPEVQKLQQSEEINNHLKAEIEILKQQLEFMQENLKTKDEQLSVKDKQLASKDEQLAAKDNQINGLLATSAQQAKVYEQMLALQAPKASETAPTQSDDKATAESPKTSFWGKLMHLFS